LTHDDGRSEGAPDSLHSLEGPPASPAAAPPSPDRPPGRPDVYVARIGDRLLAWLADAFLIGIPYSVLLMTIGDFRFVEDAEGNIDGIEIKHRVLLLAGYTVVTFLYEIIMVARTGQTLGKRWRHIVVVHLSDGSVPGWRTATARCFAKHAYELVSFVPTNLGAIYLLVDLGLGLRRPLHQCLHDLAAGTVVISDR
jgi:uncharacterized RDD family membrane protein YckC